MLHPPLVPRRTGWLETSDAHRLYWEESGAHDGTPVVMLHGGPGGATGPVSRRWFHPRHHRIITTDQRGCGRSTPFAATANNTTVHLVADLEQLREALGVETWILSGGSWGATLALAYAEAHPHRVRALLLHAVFTATAAEFDWLYGGGAASCAPEAWAAFAQGRTTRTHVLDWYAHELADPDAARVDAAAQAWCLWEDTLAADDGALSPRDPKTERSRAILGVHYARHHAFLQDGQLIDRAAGLAGVPGVIVQGTDDRVTPLRFAEALHRAWPGCRLRIVEGGGHAATSTAMMRAVLDEADRLTAGLVS